MHSLGAIQLMGEARFFLYWFDAIAALSLRPVILCKSVNIANTSSKIFLRIKNTKFSYILFVFTVEDHGATLW